MHIQNWLLVVGLLAGVALQAAEAPEKARRYEDMLVKRPQPGVVFDRFMEAWLEEASLEDLAAHLRTQAQAPEAGAGRWLLLGLVQSRQGEDQEALKAFAEGLQREPGNGAIWLERARLEARLMDFDAALKSLDSAQANQAGDGKPAIEMAKLRGRILLRTGKPEEALQVWRKLVAAHPADEELAEEVIDMQLQEGLYAEAVDQTKELISRTRDAYAKVSRQLRLGDILLRASRRPEALNEFAAALEQAGQDTWIEGEPLAQIEQVFRREDNLSGLAAHLEELAAKHPQRVALQRQLARIHAETGAKDKALAIYKDLLARTPGQRELREGYLDLLQRFEQYSEAIAQTKLLLEQNGSDRELRVRLAELQQKAGDAKAAGAELDAYLGTAAAEYDHLRVARLLEEWGRKDDARAAYASMAAAFPDSASALDAQAQFLYRIEEKEPALAIWRSLAAKGDQEQVLAVAQTLMARVEGQAAYDLLKSRAAEFEREPRYLAQLCMAALAVKASTEATPWALAWVKGSQNPDLLDEAVRRAVEVLKEAEKLDETRTQLAAQDTLSMPERALLAALLEESRDAEGAEKILRTAPPEQALEAQLRLVRLVESRQDWPRAAAELQQVLEMPEARTSQHLQRLVMLLQRSGEPEKALERVAEWKTLSPGAVQPWMVEAGLLAQLNRTEERLKVLRSAARRFDDDDTVTAALAEAYAESGQFVETERIYLGLFEKAEEMDAKLRWVTALAQAAQGRGELSKVTARFQERQQTNPQDAAPWLALAAIYQVSENPTERLKMLEEALRLRPKEVALLHQIANVQEDLGRWREAMATLERAAAVDGTTRSRQMMAMLHLRWGDEKTGRSLLMELMGGDNMAPKDALRIADGMMARGDWAEAAKFLEPFAGRHPQDYRLAYVRAVALSEDSQAEEALKGFFEVLSAKEELPEVVKAKTAAQSNSVHEYLERLRRFYPPGAMEVMQVSQNSYTARRYDYNRRYNQSSSGAGSGVGLPGNLEAAKQYTLLQLIHLRDQLPEAVRKDLAARVTQSGFEHAELLLALEPHSSSPLSLGVSDAAFDAHEKDPQFCAAWLLFNERGNRGEIVDAERCAKVFGVLQQNYPLLASHAAVSVVKADVKTGLPMLEQSLDALQKEEGEDRGFMFHNLASLLGGGQQVALERRVELPEALRKRLCAFLVDACRPGEGDRTTTAGITGNVVFAANALRAEGAWEDFIRLWQEQIDWSRDPRSKKTQATRSWSLQAGGSRDEPLLKPLPFPMPGGSLPDLFVVMMHRADPWNPHIGGDKSGPEEDYAPLAKLLNTVKDPDLRLVLAHKSGQDAEVKALLEARLQAPQPTLDDMLLAAGHAAFKDDTVTTATLLVRAMALPMEGARRAAIDAALVHATTTMKAPQREALPPEVLAAAQQSARRLRSTKLPPPQQEEVGSALVTLGLKDEAEQWKKLLATAATAPVSSGSSNRTSYSRTQSISRLDKLLSQGDEEGALRAAQQELRSLHAQYWRNSQSYAEQEARQLLEKLTFTDARKRLLEALTPAEGSSESRLLEGAEMFTVLGETGRARALYEQVLQRNPKQDAARLQLLLIHAQQDPPKAVEMLSSLSWQSLVTSGSGYNIANRLRNGDGMKFEARMALLEAIADYVDTLNAAPERPPRGAFEWLMDLPEAAASYDNNARLPALYNRRQEEEGSYYRNSKEADVKRRREVHDKVCRAMLKNAGTSAEGFRSLAGLTLFEDGDIDAMAALARQLLQEKAEDKKTGKVFRAPQNPNSWGSNRGREFWRPTPAAFLVWHAWKQGRLEQIDTELLPLAGEALEAGELKMLHSQIALWSTAPEGFAEAVKNYVKTSNSAARYGGDTAPLVDVLDCWLARKLPPAIMDEQVLAKIKTSQNYDEGYWLVRYLENRNSGDAKADEAFLLAIAKNMLGAEDQWKKRMHNHMSRYYGGGGGPTDRQAYNMNNLVTGLLRSQKLEHGFKLAGVTGLMEHPDWTGNQLRSVLNPLSGSAERTLSFLDCSPFLAGAENFSVWGASRNRGSSMMQTLVTQLKGKDDVRKAVLAHLQARQPRTFGLDVFQALLQTNAADALSTALKTHAADLAKVPQTRHPELAALVKETIPAVKKPDSMDRALREALLPIMAGELKQQAERVDAMLAASKVADLGMSDRDFERSLPLLIGEVVERDPARAKALFLKAAQLMESKTAQQGWDGDTWTQGWTLRSELLDDFNDQNPGLPALALAMRLCHEDDSGHLILDGKCNEGSWGKSLADHWKRRGGAGNPGLAMQQLCDDLAKHLDGTPPSLLALGGYEFLVKLPRGHRADVIRWADGKAAANPLAKEFAMAGRFFLATDSAAQDDERLREVLEELGGITPAWDHYRQRMQDETLNPRVRIALAAHLCRKNGQTPDEQIVRTGMRLCREAHQNLQATQGEFHFAPLALAFARLPVDEAWKEEAAKQWEAWLLRNARNNESERHNRAYQPRDGAACGMLTLVAGLGNREWMDKVLRDSRSSLNDDPAAFAVLVAMGQHEAAAAWLEQHWTNFIYRDSAEWIYSPPLAARSAEFAAACKDKELALLGELLIATLEDPPKWAQPEGFVERPARVMALVPRFKATPFAKEPLRIACLERFAHTDGTIEPLHDDYVKLMQAARYEDIATLRSTWPIWRKMKPIGRALAGYAQRAENAPILAEIDKLKAAAGADNYYGHWMAGYGVADIFWVIVREWEKGKKGDLPKYLELMEAFQTRLPRVKPDASYSESDWMVQCGLAVQLIYHASKGDATAMEAAVKRHSKDDAAMFKKLMLMRHLFTDTLARYTGRPKPLMPLEQRLELVRHLFSNKFVASLYPSTGSGNPNLMQVLCGSGKVFTEEEIPDAGRLLADVLPRKGRTAHETAELLEGTPHAAEIPVFLDLAISQSEPGSAIQAGCLLTKAAWLERADQKAEARKVLEQIAEAKLDVEAKQQRSAMLKRL